MRQKPKPKTCYSRRCVCYEIATGCRREFKSIRQMAAFIGCANTTCGMVMKSGLHTGDYIIAYIEDEQKAIVKLRTFQEKQNFKARKTKRKEVPLRIDARTVIYVTPDKATPEYAQKWKEKHEEDARHTYAKEFNEANNTLVIHKKGGKK